MNTYLFASKFDGMVASQITLAWVGQEFISLPQVQDTFDIPVTRKFTVNHPGALRPKTVSVKAKKSKGLQVTRTQISLASEHKVTYQNIQGQTVRGPESQPKGFVLDMYRPATMRGED